MARLHMKFKRIHTKTKAAAEALFAARPWSGTEEEQQSKFERFLRDASAVYSIPTPTLSVIPSLDVYGYVAPNTITLDKYSVISLFHSFRMHMQYMQTVDVAFADRNDAQAWACSLFYTIRPIQFRKMVRAGRIAGVHSTDLLSSATLAARQEEVDEAFAGLIADNFDDINIDDLEDEAADGMDEDEADDTGHTTGEDVTVAVAAERLGVSQSTVRNMLRDGRLTEVRDGRRVLVQGASLDQAVQTAE